MIEFEFVARRREESRSHSDVELFFVMDGVARFTLEDQQYLLRRDDFLVVNVDTAHSFVAEGEFLAASLRISFAKLTRMMKRRSVFFWCNTALDNSEACGEVRAIVKRIIAEQYSHRGENGIYLQSLYYSLLHVLTSAFLLNKGDSHYGDESRRFDERKHEIEEYIRLNFDKPITLDDLANHLFLSYAYLSKYIKRHFGTGFADYLNSVRLEYAVSQLLHSEEPVVRIAMESGFASSAALNKAFKDKYRTTPTEYRKRWKTEGTGDPADREEEEAVARQLRRHFTETERPDPERDKKVPEERVTLQGGQKRLLKKNWSRMINVGTAADLLQSDLQRQLLTLREELGFQYVRFWDLYDPDMYLGQPGAAQEFNFDNLDRVLDFLLENEMKPYIELRPKPKKVLGSKDRTLLYKGEGEEVSPEETEEFLRKLIIHLINRYNTEQVESWYFEIWNAEPEEVLLQIDLAKSVMTSLHYLDYFQRAARVLRGYLPGIRLGGGGFSLRYGEDLMRNVLEDWQKLDQLPDFVSIYCYPYSQESIDKGRNQVKTADYLRDSVARVREIMEETNFPTQELHVTEWSFSVSNRNVLNDHCMKGAYLVRNMIDAVDLCDIMGYWLASDLYGALHDTRTVLNGGCGLLSKGGIRKPAFYAFSFMNRLGRYLRKRGEHYIISDNGAGNWRVVCHNLKDLNFQYGLQEEDEIKAWEQNNLFADLKKLRLHFELPGKSGGKYFLRIHSVNQHAGSVQDEWVAMSAPEELSREDLKYLDRITTPRMVIRERVAENDKIVFDLTLEPNEIAYIHVTYQYA